MSGANPAFNFAPTSASNSAAVDSRLTQASPTQPTEVSPVDRTQTGASTLRAEQVEAQDWEECLRQLGQELLQVRQARGISLYQLHLQTLVPLNHLKALETGKIDKLPQDIYVRGFIRRLGDGLGLDGARMAASIPARVPVNSLDSSTNRNASSLGFALGPVHFYLGYAVLMVVAVGALLLLSHQATPDSDSSQLRDNTVELNR
jgi:hypothetical protein